MKRALFVVAGCLAGVALASVSTRPARAIPAFKAEFDAKYVKKDSTDPAEKALAEAVKEVKCNVCHVGTDKKQRNAYGQALAELLDKKEDAKNKQKIQEALDKVAAMKCDPEKPDGPTFGDLLKGGKLPAEK